MIKKFFLIACFFMGGIAIAQAQQTSPVWPGCEDSEDVSACFNKKLAEHVREHYKYPMEGNTYVRGKVTISFNINKEGEVEVVSIEGDEPKVNAAAKKMILAIPKMKPGTLNGKPDSRNFTVPFNF